ncbi:importin-alpha export receptor, partial [Teratosphaeriaceae sp. CCFEE 6253]
ALLQLLINPPLPPAAGGPGGGGAEDQVIEDRDTEDLAFGAAFTQLNTCRPVAPRDPWPGIRDVRVWVGETLREADKRHAGRVGRAVREKLGGEEREALMAVMA